MLRLPSRIFHYAMQFASPKQAFAMKGVCKHIKTECEKSSLWKGILKAQHPDFPLLEADNYESVVRELLQAEFQLPQINDFDFVITIYDDDFTIYVADGKIGTEKCTFSIYDARVEIQEENLKAHLLRILKREVQPGDLKLRCYVILRYQGKKQFRTRDFKFNDSDWEDGHMDLEFFSQVGETFFEIRFYNQNGRVSVSISVFVDDEHIFSNEA